MSDSMRDDRRNTGHGHVYPRPDGIKARCGGPAICKECALDFARFSLQTSGACNAYKRPEGIMGGTCLNCGHTQPEHVDQAIMCNHANGVPAVCDCPPTCYCKKHTCWTVTPIQPQPIKNDNPAIQNLVLADIETRKTIGLERYGTLLQADNGRDMLKDAYEEALDLCIYLRGALYERDRK